MRMALYVVLLLGGIAGFFVGGSIMKASQSAVHEIEALICFLIGAVCIGCLTVAAALEHHLDGHMKEMRDLLRAQVTTNKLIERHTQLLEQPRAESKPARAGTES